jgi:glutathione S-transferase
MRKAVKLFMVGASPYARKVLVFATERGLCDRIELVKANPHERPPELVEANPLSKVPTLVADDGSVHVDSLAICLYLDTLGDAAPLAPLEGPDRWTVMQGHALANGILDAAVTRRMESLRAAEPDRLAWMDRQHQTIIRVLDRVEAQIGRFGDEPRLDTITLACALSYLDFRFPDDGWRKWRPRLVEWHARFEQRPSMQSTSFTG